MDAEPDRILQDTVPAALALLQRELGSGAAFCDRFGTPLAGVARRVADLLLIEQQCRDPAAVVAAILADLPETPAIADTIQVDPSPIQSENNSIGAGCRTSLGRVM